MTNGPDLQPNRAASSPDRDRSTAATPGMPRWVKTLIVLAVALVAVLVVAKLLTGGHGGPGRHLGSGPVSTSSATYPATVSSQAATTQS